MADRLPAMDVVRRIPLNAVADFGAEGKATQLGGLESVERPDVAKRQPALPPFRSLPQRPDDGTELDRPGGQIDDLVAHQSGLAAQDIQEKLDGKEARVTVVEVTIEAGQAAFDILTKNIAENQYTNVKALHLAAWDSETTLHLGGVREDMLGWGKVQTDSTAQTEAVPARRLDQAQPALQERAMRLRLARDVEGVRLADGGDETRSGGLAPADRDLRRRARWGDRARVLS